MQLIRDRSSHTTNTTNADEHLRAILSIHLHAKHGSDYWLQRQSALGWNVLDGVRNVADVWKLGPTNLDDLRKRPIRDFIPRAFHHQMNRFVTGETAGTSGKPCSTAYREDEFEAAFITPFLRVAEATRFPRETPWLWVGPSGPHIIGKVVRELARRMGNIDPFSVDFDPRWAKRLATGSLGQQRYLDHVTTQAIDVLKREEIGVIFTTPPALAALAKKMTEQQREIISGVHYGGMSLKPETVNDFREMFPNAIHLAGYGNTLFGVVMETVDRPRIAMDYFPLSDRVLFDVVRAGETWAVQSLGQGKRGQVMFHRLDESALLVNVIERDEAELIPVSPEARLLGGFSLGLRDPGPPAILKDKLQHGLY